MDNLKQASLPEAFRIARTHYDAGRMKKAERVCRRILNTFPGHPRSMHLLGLLHYKKGEYKQAEEYLRQAVEGRPTLSHFHNDLGASLSSLGRHAEALAAYREAERLADPGNTAQIKSVYRNIALALQRVGRIDDAMEYHARMLAIIPDDLETFWNRSHIYLARGQFKRGWEGYETRLQLQSHWKVFERQRNSEKVWDGKPFPGKTLLVQDEQGLGDAFQFVRFLPLVKALGGTVVFETRQIMKGILSSAPGFDEIINRIEAEKRYAEFDLTVPLMSLPRILGIDLDNLPAEIPYLHAEKERLQRWQQRIEGEGLKVGLVWTGNLENLSLRHRSIELADLAPFLDVPGVSLYSLQYGATRESFKDLPDGMTVHDLGDDVADFEELAAAAVNLDLVITVDTAMAHIAGALGCPTWVLISYPADWRWLLDREDSPWYPGMRLFRQGQSGRWGAVFLQLHKALCELAGQHGC